MTEGTRSLKTSEQFRASVARLAAYRADHPTRAPAFIGHLDGRLTTGRLAEGRVLPSGRADLLTIARASREMAAGALRSVDLVRQAYAAIASWEPRVHAFEHIVPGDTALREAAARDAAPADARGPLWGVPLTVKDIIHVSGLPTTASSRAMRGVVPIQDGEAVNRLKAAGAIILGKTTTHEFAMGVTTPQSRNPWDLTRDPGGSSGGSAIAVATGMGLGSLGTDTRASIRVPAALCGVVGFKPTFGLVSTHGVVTMSWSMDHVAPMARTTEDIALLLNVLVGHDAKDPGTVRRPLSDYRSSLNASVRGLRVGIPTNGLRNAQPAVIGLYREAVDALSRQGVEILDVPEPTVDDFELANAAGLIVSRCEAVAIHKTLLDAAPDYSTDPVREQIAEARRVLAVEYIEAQRYRAELTERMVRLLGSVDALALPTSRVVAPRADESDQYLLVLSENCVPWSFIGFPAVSIPCGLTRDERLPVGLELVAGPFEEGVLLALGSAVEAALGMPVLP